MTLKLEVGKTYIDRRGVKVQITAHKNGDFYNETFIGASGDDYYSNGRYFLNKDSQFDLISEHVEPVATVQPAARIPHKWATEIHAYADGREIEVYMYGFWVLAEEPVWNPTQLYRVKPAPLKPIQVRFIALIGDELGTTVHEELATVKSLFPGKAIRIEYDPNTAELVSAVVVVTL